VSSAISARTDKNIFFSQRREDAKERLLCLCFSLRLRAFARIIFIIPDGVKSGEVPPSDDFYQGLLSQASAKPH
jgi:hypothetical protein